MVELIAYQSLRRPSVLHPQFLGRMAKLHGITALEINFLTSNHLLVNINLLYETLEMKSF